MVTQIQSIIQAKWEQAVISKLKAEGLSIASEWLAIEACLARVVAPNKCIAIARDLKMSAVGGTDNGSE